MFVTQLSQMKMFLSENVAEVILTNIGRLLSQNPKLFMKQPIFTKYRLTIDRQKATFTKCRSLRLFDGFANKGHIARHLRTGPSAGESGSDDDFDTPLRRK